MVYISGCTANVLLCVQKETLHLGFEPECVPSLGIPDPYGGTVFHLTVAATSIRFRLSNKNTFLINTTSLYYPNRLTRLTNRLTNKRTNYIVADLAVVYLPPP